MNKSTVPLSVGVGCNNKKEVVMFISMNNPGPVANNGGVIVLSTIVLMVGITLVGAIGLCGSW